VVPPVWQETWFVGLMVVLVGTIGLQTARIVSREQEVARCPAAGDCGDGEGVGGGSGDADGAAS
jgi:hypothetical protein